jgi:predicted metal-binding membrane protein
VDGAGLGSLGAYLPTWVAMMAGMMLPSATPMVRAHAAVERRKRQLGRDARLGATAAFVVGYLLVWTGFGLVAFALYESVGALDLDVLMWDHGGRYVAAGVIVVAAVYQLTPVKDVCLSKCRSPLGFLLGSWRDGPSGAFAMGAKSGAWCVGCCWALMASLFALGVMSIWWMAVVAGLIALEKTLPWRRVATYGGAAVLLAGAVLLMAIPSAIPGLTIPGSRPMPSMSQMSSPPK